MYSSSTAITKIKCFEDNQIYISYCCASCGMSACLMEAVDPIAVHILSCTCYNVCPLSPTLEPQRAAGV